MHRTRAVDGHDRYRLRFVFDDGAASFGHGDEITYGDVAQTLEELTQERSDTLMRIDFVDAGDVARKTSTGAYIPSSSTVSSPQPPHAAVARETC